MVTGVIAEFNPFHNGHAYLLSQIPGLKIVAMSGNFTQRGEPAIVDKWIRAQMALENGADIVVELPTLVSVQAADFFAQGAVALLHRLGIQKLAFGTEEILDYGKIATIYAEQQSEMTSFLASLPQELSYPEKAQRMWEQFAGITFSGDTPNHVLALAYAKAVAGKEIALAPIQRKGAGFHSLDSHLEFASATALRKNIDDRTFVRKFSPHSALLEKAPHVSWEHYFFYLKYQILSIPDLSKIYQVNQEMANRIQQAIHTVSSVEELIEKVATKRYTKARVKRLLTYILLHAQEMPVPNAIHILGFTDEGRHYLAHVKKRVPLVSRIGKEAWDSLTQKADRIYQLGHPQISEQTFGRIPIYLSKK